MKKDWMIKESELDDDQVAVLMATLEKSCIVSGCAGSGKSVLALIKAKRIQEKYGKNYQVIVLTKALCRYMNSGREELGLANGFSYHWDWKNRRNSPSSDVIIVDEIQDFAEDEILEFIGSAKKHFFFFGDTAQSIYSGLKTTLPVAEISRLPGAGNAKTFELYRNYRLPIPVARVAHAVGVGLDVFLESTYKSRESALPRFIGYSDKKAQLEAISRIIETRHLTDVAVLLFHNASVQSVYSAMSEKINCEVKYEDKEDWHNSKNNLDFGTTNTKIMTFHSAKGLQFETVFIPYMEDFAVKSDGDRKALYVAMTRTYRNLYVFYSGQQLPDVFKGIDASLYGTSERDEEIEDI